MLSLLVWHPAKADPFRGKKAPMAEKRWHRLWGARPGGSGAWCSHTAPGKWSHKICIPVSYPEGCSRFCLNVHQEENELQVSISPRENLFPETLQLMKWGSINSSIITMRALALCPALPLTLFTLITSGLPLHSSIG